MKWFYTQRENQIGPISETALHELKSAGIISHETPIRREDSEQWTTFHAAFSHPQDSSQPPPLPTGHESNVPLSDTQNPTSAHQKTVPIRSSKSKAFKITVGIIALVLIAVVFAVFQIRKVYNERLADRLVDEADKITHASPTEDDWRKVVSLLKDAVDLGNHEAEFKLGSCFLFGRGVPLDSQEAAKLFRQSAEGGYAEGQFNLSVCYAQGNGVNQNEEEMLKWLKMAAEQDLPEAQHGLGKLYLHGQAVPQNKTKGINMISAAANQGNTTAQYDLSLCFELGNGVPKDLVQSYKWAIIATRSGLSGGDEAVEGIRKKLSPSQAHEGHRLADEWDRTQSRP